MKFTKVKSTHHILPDFHKLLLCIEKYPKISRIIPGRISRQQKGTSDLYFNISYFTSSGLKCVMNKWATSQELFIICKEEDKENVAAFVLKTIQDTSKF